MEGSIKDYIEGQHKKVEDFKNKWENLIKESTSILDLSETELLELFRLFEYPVSVRSIFF